MNIILTGMPCCGKTTVAYKLSELLGLDVIDTDAEIVKNYGAINDIFENYGEQAFRNLETEVVKSICNQSCVIISTGGGCVLREENVSLFKQSGKIVYLKTRLATLFNRVKCDTFRPLLNGCAEEKMEKLFKERTPIYENSADIIVDTDGLTPEQIAETISKLLKSL